MYVGAMLCSVTYLQPTSAFTQSEITDDFKDNTEPTNRPQLKQLVPKKNAPSDI